MKHGDFLPIPTFSAVFNFAAYFLHQSGCAAKWYSDLAIDLGVSFSVLFTNSS